jgi:rhodanese-related sulfurtransferase
MKQVDVSTLATVAEGGATVIDVREADEYAAGHVPGARLLPLPQLAARARELDTAAPVYVVCQSGNRSKVAVDLLTSLGFDATNVAGGTAAWRQAGKPVDTGLS